MEMEPFDERETISVPNDDGSGSAQLFRARVTGVRFFGSGRELVLEVDRRHWTVGADIACDVWIDDPCVSWRHCRFEHSGAGRVLLRDLRSKNGTFVDGNRIEAIELRAGMRITVGKTSLLTLGEQGGRPASALESLCGEDPAFRDAIDLAVRAGRGDCAVLIRGETGTGKELFARLVHESSARVRQPFVAVNCGAIPRDLISSELFGHERGAFTGAVCERDGVFVQADRGTLFLDEIGELPLEQQPNLLRVLETRRVRRVGGRAERAVDVGLVAATHRTGECLRQDLYHRLATVVIELPPLRERRADIPLLVTSFVDELASTYGTREVPPGVMGRLCAYPWHGNVRELRQAVRRAVALSGARVLEFDDFLPPASRFERDNGAARAVRRPAPAPLPEGSADAMMRDLIRETLEREGSIRRAAIALGVSKSTLGERVRRYGIKSPGRRLRKVL